MRKFTAAAVAVITAILGVTFAPTAGAVPGNDAAAERVGAFVSYIEGANNGFLSRLWTDYNDDATDGLIKFVGCSSNPLVGIVNHRTGAIVVHEIMWCLNSEDDFYHGRLPAGDYRFVIIDKRSNVRLDVDNVYVRYQSGAIVT